MVYVYESKIYGVLGFDPFPHVQWSKYRVYIYISCIIYYIYGGMAIPPSWLTFQWDQWVYHKFSCWMMLMSHKMLVAKPIIQPILPIFDHGILDPASSSVKYLGGSGQGMTWPEALEIRMASPSSVKVKPTSVGKQPFGHLAICYSWLQLLLTDGIWMDLMINL